MRWRGLAPVGLAVTFGCLLGCVLGYLLGHGTLLSIAPAAAARTELDPRPAAATLEEAAAELTADERRTVQIFRRASASVVHVANLALRQDLFSFDVLKIQQGTGSGFVWDAHGHVVTNFHVIDGGDSFKVRLADQSEYPATVVGYAANKDLAVLKVAAPAGKLVPLPLGASHRLLVGQIVLAVGNPFGLDHSLTVGVVSRAAARSCPASESLPFPIRWRSATGSRAWSSRRCSRAVPPPNRASKASGAAAAESSSWATRSWRSTASASRPSTICSTSSSSRESGPSSS
jgi:S1-C subfamily serine protease